MHRNWKFFHWLIFFTGVWLIGSLAAFWYIWNNSDNMLPDRQQYNIMESDIESEDTSLDVGEKEINMVPYQYINW